MAFLPIGSRSMFWPCPRRSSMNFCAALPMLELKPPAKPLSPAMTSTSTFFSSRSTSSGCMTSPVASSNRSVRRTSDSSTLVSICAYGRAASARSCARRSLAAETICMALVICRVLRTLRIRRRMSKRFAIVLLQSLRLNFCRCRLPLAYKTLLKFLERFLHVRLDAVINRLLLHNRRKQLRIHGLNVFIQLFREGANIFHFKIVQIAVGAGKNNHDLLAERERLILVLLQDFHQSLTAIQLGLRCFIKVRAELRKGRQFTILRQFQLQRAGNLTHGLD